MWTNSKSNGNFMVFTFIINSQVSRPRVLPPPPAEMIQAFNESIDMLQQAVNSQEFLQLFLDICREFATALHFEWDHDTAEREWDEWIALHPIPDYFLNIQLTGKQLTARFGQFTPVTRSIDVDTTLLLDLGSVGHFTLPKFLFFIKGLHEIAHSLTELILLFLKHLYRNEPYKKRKHIPTKHTPVQVGKVSKNEGDCGYILEECLSGNLRFTYQAYPDYVNAVQAIVVQTRNARRGYYVSQQMIDLIIASPNHFYTICRAHLRNRAQLVQVSDDDFKHLVVNCNTKQINTLPRGVKV